MVWRNIIESHYKELLEKGNTAYSKSIEQIDAEYIIWITCDGVVCYHIYDCGDYVPRNVCNDECCVIFDFDGREYDVKKCLDKRYEEIKNKEMENVLECQRKAEREEMLCSIMQNAIDNVITDYLSKTKLDSGGDRYNNIGEDDDIFREEMKLSTMLFNALEN